MKIRLLKLLDKFMGVFIVRLLSSPNQYFTGTPVSILFIRPGGIGDAVLLVPVIHEVKMRFPHAAIHVLAEKRNSAVLKLCPAVHTVMDYDSPRDFLSVFRKQYDIVIDTEQWYRLSALVARSLGSPMIIGYATNERKRLLTHPVSYSQNDYEVNSFYKLLSPVIPFAIPDFNPPFLTIPLELLNRADGYLRSVSDLPLVAIFPGGSIPQKKWDNSKFRELSIILISHGYGIVVVGGKEDCASGEEIIRNLSSCINVCGKLTLIETTAVLKKVVLLVTGDSGIMHIAYGVGTKLVALFGPSNAKKWAPRGANAVVVRKDMECSPCSQFGNIPHCRRNYACMRQITVNEVVEKTIALLKR